MQHKLPLGVLVLLHFFMTAASQNCDLQVSCGAMGLQTYKLIGHPNGPLVDQITMSCPWRSFVSGVVQVVWLFTPNTRTQPQVLDTSGTDPHFEQDGYNLLVKNPAADMEGIYSCRVMQSSGTQSTSQAAGCLYISGQAYFNSCPAAPQVEAPVDPASACSGVIPLTRETGDDVNFDTRVEYRNGGSCGVEQSIRLMILRQLGSETVTHYICSNLGSNSRNPCSNRTRVSVMYHGGNKYDITLRLHNVKESDSGMYEVSVDLNDAYGGRRTTIIKTFELSVQAKPVIETTTSVPSTGSPVGEECSHADAPLLLLNGMEKENGTNITFSEIGRGSGALMCVGNHLDGKTANFFVVPDKTPVGDDSSNGGLFVSRGKHVLGLNYAMGSDTPQEGLYCCPDINSSQNTCLNISQ